MKTRVQRWGNSLAVRIPKAYAAEVGLDDGSPVELRVDRGKIVLELAAPPAPKLEDLLSKVRKSNLHGEVDTGQPVGREVW